MAKPEELEEPEVDPIEEEQRKSIDPTLAANVAIIEGGS